MQSFKDRRRERFLTILFKRKSLNVNAHIPRFFQRENLRNHSRTIEDFLRTTIPSNFSGLGTIDWEKWRPIWKRNWNSKSVYKDAARLKIKESHGDWSKEKVETEAKKKFEAAAR